MITVNYVDRLDENIGCFSDCYGTDIIAIFPDKKEIYVEDMGQFLKAYFAEWDDDVFVDTEHNMRQVSHSPLSEGTPYQVFLQDDDTGYTIIGEYDFIEDAEEAIENCHTRQYNITVAMNFEVTVTVTANSLSEAEDAAYDFCNDSMNLENHYTHDENIDEWDITDTNVEITDSELA